MPDGGPSEWDSFVTGMTFGAEAIGAAAPKAATGAVKLAEGNVLGGAIDLVSAVIAGGISIFDNFEDMNARAEAQSTAEREAQLKDTAMRTAKISMDTIKAGTYGKEAKTQFANISKSVSAGYNAVSNRDPSGAVTSAQQIYDQLQKLGPRSGAASGDIGVRMTSGSIQTDPTGTYSAQSAA